MQKVYDNRTKPFFKHKNFTFCPPWETGRVAETTIFLLGQAACSTSKSLIFDFFTSPVYDQARRETKMIRSELAG